MVGDDSLSGNDQGAVAAADAVFLHLGLEEFGHGGGGADAALTGALLQEEQ